mmetsp:Transcript_21097/g.50172  ORF Transcript_21097/g.50172 Transcript_21097/m.50172 type:complete len:243 (+) Transcript_21097:605-1333(+)
MSQQRLQLIRRLVRALPRKWLGHVQNAGLLRTLLLWAPGGKDGALPCFAEVRSALGCRLQLPDAKVHARVLDLRQALVQLIQVFRLGGELLLCRLELRLKVLLPIRVHLLQHVGQVSPQFLVLVPNHGCNELLVLLVARQAAAASASGLCCQGVQGALHLLRAQLLHREVLREPLHVLLGLVRQEPRLVHRHFQREQLVSLLRQMLPDGGLHVLTMDALVSHVLCQAHHVLLRGVRHGAHVL